MFPVKPAPQMLVTIHQPNYLPWPGFFHKWMLADAFVVLDTVQFSRSDWQNRNRIKTANGPRWLTVPVRYHFPALINEVEIIQGSWQRKQVAALEQAYARAPFFHDYWRGIRPVLVRPWRKMSDMNVSLIRLLGKMVGCQAPLYLASEMQADNTDPTGRLIDLCRELDGSDYLAGIDGKKYMNIRQFKDAGINVWYQDVAAPVYPQLHGEFVAHLSVLDLLFNVGAEACCVIRKMGGKVQ